jgi:hypothetical protein
MRDGGSGNALTLIVEVLLRHPPTVVGYHQPLTKWLALLAVVACSKTDDKKPSAAADPWAARAAPTPTATAGDDPWTVEPTPAEQEPPDPELPTIVTTDDPALPKAPPASGDTNTLAGSYQCLQLRNGRAYNGARQSTYGASALGVFEIDGDGAYRSTSYPTRGTGRARANGTTVTFEDGPYPNVVGVAETNSSGFHIRFSEHLDETPAPDLRFNDHVCNRK